MSLLFNPFGYALIITLLEGVVPLTFSSPMHLLSEERTTRRKASWIKESTISHKKDSTSIKSNKAFTISSDIEEKKVVINEVVTDPQQDWSSNDFNGIPGTGRVSNVDEYVELYIQSAGLDLSNWSIELKDGTDFSGDLTSSGAFDRSIYNSVKGGTFNNTAVGDFLLLANPDGANAMNNDVHIILKDANGVVVDEVKLGGKEGEAPDGNASNASNEAVFRSPNGSDSGNDLEDFVKGPATLSQVNPDLKEPAFENGSPVLSTVGQSKITLHVDLDEAGTVYFIVTDTEEAKPSPIQIKEGKRNNNTVPIKVGSKELASGDYSHDLLIEGLNPSTTYDVYAVAEDNASNLQQVPTKLTFQTQGLPELVVGKSSGFGDESVASASVQLVLSEEAKEEVKVDYIITGTANGEGIDHSLTNGTFRIPAGEQTATLTLSGIIDDQVYEEDETIIVTFSNPIHAVLGQQNVFTYTINDNDEVLPSLSFRKTAGSGSEKESAIELILELSQSTDQEVQVDYIITGTASGEGIDHSLTTGTLRIPAGEQTATLTLSGIVDDQVDEEDETIIVTLANPIHAVLGQQNVFTYSINDNDEVLPSLFFRETAGSGSENEPTIELILELSQSTDQEVQVDYIITGTASGEGIDHGMTNGTLRIPAGEQTATLTLSGIIDDQVDEEDETIIVTLSNPIHAVLGEQTAYTFIIQDNDPFPRISFDQKASSGLEDLNSVSIPVTLNSASQKEISVKYFLTGTADGSDYDKGSGTLRFYPGETRKSFSVNGIIDDNMIEANETIIVTLYGPTNGLLDNDSVFTYTILNNDTAKISIENSSGVEDAGLIDVELRLDKKVDGGFTVFLKTANGTASSLKEPDYIPIEKHPIRFEGIPGEIQTLRLSPLADNKLETNETLIVEIIEVAPNLAEPEALDITDQALVTILNDDKAELTISNKNAKENQGEVIVDVFLNNAVEDGFKVKVSSKDSTAKATDDFVPIVEYPLIFTGVAGEVQSFPIKLIDDLSEEPHESFNLFIADLSETTLAIETSAEASITIRDDDDNTPPSGYLVILSDTLIGKEELIEASFSFQNAEVGSTYQYAMSSSGGSTTISYSGKIITATDTVPLPGLSLLPDGQITLSVMLKDSLGNVGIPIERNAVKDTMAPATPAITSVSADTGLSGTDKVTNDTSLVIMGKAEKEVLVEVFLDDVSIGITPADSSGEFRFDYTERELSDGSYVVRAKATDAAGNSGEMSRGVRITIDTQEPAYPLLSSVTTDSGNLQTGSVTNDQTLRITGTSEANCQIHVFLEERTLGSTQSNAMGEWSFDYTETSLEEGFYSFTAAATDQAGNTSTKSPAFNLTIDVSQPLPPTIVLEEASDWGQSSTDRLTSNKKPTVSGAAEPYSVVGLRINERLIDSIHLTKDGQWRHEVSAPLEIGINVFSAYAMDQAGNTSLPTEYSVWLDTALSTPVLYPQPHAARLLPGISLQMVFPEKVIKGKGNILLKKSSNDEIIEVMDVSSTNVAIQDSVVIITPSEDTFVLGESYYALIESGVFEDMAGNEYLGVQKKEEWAFTIISPPIVSSVSHPMDSIVGIDAILKFRLEFDREVSIQGSPTFNVKIGDTERAAGLISEVKNQPHAEFGLVVQEGDYDEDGWEIAHQISLNDGHIKDQHGIDANLTLPSQPKTIRLKIDGKRPKPTLSSEVDTLINSAFTLKVAFDEVVHGLSVEDLDVKNGVVKKLEKRTESFEWLATILPLADGYCTVSLPEGAVYDLAENSSLASVDSIQTRIDLTPPRVLAIERLKTNPLHTTDREASFVIIFSEEITGVDLLDFRLNTTGTARGQLNEVIQIDETTYQVDLHRISGQGTIGIALSRSQNITDMASNRLIADVTGERYVMNWIPMAIELSNSEIKENNEKGELIGLLSTVDFDESDEHTYSLVDGAGGQDNQRFSIQGQRLLAQESFDFETNRSHSLRIRVEDGKGGIKEKVFKINVLNQAEASIFISGEGDFGEVVLGAISTNIWSVTNNGELPVEVRFARSMPSFSISPNTLKIPIGQSIQVTAAFRPDRAGEYNGLINLSYEGGVASEVVRGTGVLVTEIAESLGDGEVLVYPNPVNASLIIDLSRLISLPVKLELYDLTGQLLLTQYSRDRSSLQIDLSTYKKGWYLLRIHHELGVIERRVLVKR